MPISIKKNKTIIIQLILLLFLSAANTVLAQTDTIYAKLIFKQNSDIVHVKQTFSIIDRTEDRMPLYMYAWINAYNRNSTLSKIKLSERNDQLFFANKENLGKLLNLKVWDNDTNLTPSFLGSSEVFEINAKPNKKTGRFKFKASYDLQITADGFTGYGYNKQQGSYYLKYFLLHPGVYENGLFKWQNFKDFESLTSNNTFYKIAIENNTDVDIFTDLKIINDSVFVGDNRSFFELALLNHKQITQIKLDSTNIIFQEKIDSTDIPILKKALTRQINFLGNYFSDLDEPLFISNKLFSHNRISSIEDIKIPVINKRYKIFDDFTRLDLKYLQSVFSAFSERNIHVNKRKEHWILNGIKMYLVLKYLEKYHSETPILGNAPSDLGLFDIHPAKWYESSKLKFIDRFPMYYRYFMKQNIDQPINTPYDKLSYNNQIQISGIKTALALEYLDSYLEKGELETLLKNLIKTNEEKLITEIDLKQYLEKHASKQTDWFFDDIMKSSGSFDFKISSIKRKNDSLQINIKNKNQFNAPTEIVASKDSTILYDAWVNSNEKNIKFNIPQADYDEIKIKHGNYFTDNNIYNDVYYKNKWLKTKLKLSPVGDYQTADFYQLFLWPIVRWNNYDKLQLGLNITNETIFPQDFVVKIAPLYSFGTKKYVGSTGLTYKWKPESNIFREIDFRMGSSIGHYNQGLEYFKYSSGITFSLRKPVRSLTSHFVEIGFNDIQRELPIDPKPVEVELQRYQLLNTKFTFRNLSKINESLGYVNYQYSNKFSKIYGEFYYRWKFAKNRRLGIRVFGGLFFRHDLNETDYYDFGLDRITDYSFLHGLLGRSEKIGFLSQQFVMAEGGFKSNFNIKSNKYLVTLNLEYPVIKMIDAYADFGVYQNKDFSAKFLYDSGLRLSIVPDFVELYFPIQSSLGFEPSMPRYHERIRFLLNLNLNRIRDYWRARKLQL